MHVYPYQVMQPGVLWARSRYSALKYTHDPTSSVTLNWHMKACACLGGCVVQAENARDENAGSLNYFRCGREIRFLNEVFLQSLCRMEGSDDAWARNPAILSCLLNGRQLSSLLINAALIYSICSSSLIKIETSFSNCV